MSSKDFMEVISGLCPNWFLNHDAFFSEDKVTAPLWSDLRLRRRIKSWFLCYETKNELKFETEATKYRIKGNKEFKSKKYTDSIESYTKCALYAPEHSDILPISIANRSASLFELARYKDCLRDIESATLLGYPQDLHYKLLLRAVQCHIKLSKQNLAKKALQQLQEILNTSNNIIGAKRSDIETRIAELTLHVSNIPRDTENVPSSSPQSLMTEVAFGKHPDILSVSVCLDLKYKKELGRCMIANRPIKKGDILLVEKPAVFVPLALDESRDICYNCCQSYGDLPIPCTTCCNTKYCGVKCLKQGWSSYHRWECPGSQMNLWQQIGVGHIAIRMLLHATVTTDKVLFNDVQNLMTHIEHRSQRDLYTFGCTAVMLTTYLLTYTDYFKVNDFKTCLAEKFTDDNRNFDINPCDPDDDKRCIYISALILRNLLQGTINAYTIDKYSTENFDAPSIGSGIYSSASLFNHSCDPSVVNIFRGQYLIVRAVKDISAGEEVFSCYGPCYQEMPWPLRKLTLETQYYFTCHCYYCTVAINSQENGVMFS